MILAVCYASLRDAKSSVCEMLNAVFGKMGQVLVGRNHAEIYFRWIVGLARRPRLGRSFAYPELRPTLTQESKAGRFAYAPMIGCGRPVLLVYSDTCHADCRALSPVRDTPARGWQPLGVGSRG